MLEAKFTPSLLRSANSTSVQLPNALVVGAGSSTVVLLIRVHALDRVFRGEGFWDLASVPLNQDM